MHHFEDQTGGRGLAARAAGLAGTLKFLAVLAFLVAGVPGIATAQPAAAASTAQPPMILPSAAGTSSSGAGSSSESWIVGGYPGKKTAGLAAAAGAISIDGRLGSYRIPRNRANQFAKRLRKAGRLVYAEPDVPITRTGYPLDRFFEEQTWLNKIVNPSDVTPPEATSKSPMIALIEESLDPLHPDLLAARLSGARSLGPEADWHGTAVAGIAGSPGEMQGIRGVWPGARMRLFPSGLKCSTAAKAVAKAVDRGAKVINMSYTFPAGSCFAHFKATQYAVRKGAVPVAAAGNSGDTGNSPMRPAVDPHVISVGSVDDDLKIAPFSTRNSMVDLTAPGVGVLAPTVSAASVSIPVTRDWQKVSGTSFSAPMVSATAAWLAQARPELGSLQIARLLTSSATDLGEPGRDPEYGEGLLSIENSLTAPNPPVDPYEPNDDVHWIDGSLLGAKSPFLWRAGAGKRRILSATLSRAKDPADVYRVLIPARRRIVVNLNQLEGDVTLSAYKPRTKSIARKPGKNLIVRSNRPYPKTEGIVVRNLRKKPQTIWLGIAPGPTQLGNDAAYRIKVVRR